MFLRRVHFCIATLEVGRFMQGFPCQQQLVFVLTLPVIYINLLTRRCTTSITVRSVDDVALLQLLANADTRTGPRFVDGV